MKHKYIIQKNGDAEALSIKEYAELDKGMFSFVCEEKYDPKRFQRILTKGEKPLLAILRTTNFFPPSQFAEQIARSFAALLSSPDQDSVELLCDDTEILKGSDEVTKKNKEVDVETDSLDDFIEEDDSVESDFDETVNTRDGVTTIKIDTDTDDAADLDETP